uniref:Methylated-DNA--protein-cysteine methyltransferase n=1 Tax=Thermodesulfovibrio aggregans TaxID=86166 RepID=A0A7C4ELS8_9BACT
MYTACIETPIGLFKIFFDNSFAVIKIKVCEGKNKCPDNSVPTEVFEKFSKNLNMYFKGEIKEFSYPYRLKGCSDFEKKVLEFVSRIPYGKTVSYKWIAQRLSTSPRAVGQALKRNPLPVLIPCHRVIKADGSLGGYCLGLKAKKWLIEHENFILCKLLLHKI